MSDDELKGWSKNALIREVRRLRDALHAGGGEVRGDEPRVDRGTVAGPGDDPYARHSVVYDARNAVLLDSVDVSAVEPYKDGEPQNVVLALVLAGRVNKATDRAEHMYLFDGDGAAGIVSELIGLASRVGPEFAKLLMSRLDDMPMGRP